MENGRYNGEREYNQSINQSINIRLIKVGSDVPRVKSDFAGVGSAFWEPGSLSDVISDSHG